MKTYEHNVKIYQEYKELPAADVMTPLMITHLLFGSFVIGKDAGAIGIRAGGMITGNESYFLACGITGDM